MIPPVLAATAASTALGAISAIADTVSAKRNDQLDRTDFLNLLVAQLQSQDPLNPMDGAQFSTQLAQFSSLEQLMSINQRLDKLVSGDGLSSADPVALLGREVAVAGGALTVEGGRPGAVSYALGEAGTVSLQIVDAGGKEVASLDLGAQTAGQHSADLSALPGASDLADGDYTVRLRLETAAGETRDVEARVFARVTGVDLSSNPPVLLVGERRVAFDDVREVREASASNAA